MIDVQDLVSSASAGGWDWFGGVDEKVQEALNLDQKKSNEDQAAIATAWADFAATPGGQKALQQLFDNTLLRTVFFVSLGLDPQSMATYGAFREGQNSVAHLIARLIAEGRGETTKPRDV
ncbi:hypothetical protein IWQ51_001728 [Labrenzia sp. EL_142]|nr:hypothetical protein [Labrenzia sp. EL_142]